MKCIDRWVRGVLLVICLGVLPNACVVGIVDLNDDDGHSGDKEASAVFARTVPAGGLELLRVSGANGAIEVDGAEGAQEVTIHAIRRVRSDSRHDAEDHLHLVEVAVRTDPEAVLVETVQPKNTKGRTYVVDYEITIPADWDVVVTNGNGIVCVESLEGDVEIQNGNGNVTLQEVVGSSWVTLGNGTVDAHSWLPDGGQIIHSVGNGILRLKLQPDVSADFRANVGNGPIVLSGFTLHQTVSGPGFLHGILGDGDGLVELSVGNGSIEVKEH